MNKNKSTLNKINLQKQTKENTGSNYCLKISYKKTLQLIYQYNRKKKKILFFGAPGTFSKNNIFSSLSSNYYFLSTFYSYRQLKNIYKKDLFKIDLIINLDKRINREVITRLNKEFKIPIIFLDEGISKNRLALFLKMIILIISNRH